MNDNQEQYDTSMGERYNAMISACSSPLLVQGKADAAFNFMEICHEIREMPNRTDSLQNALANVDSQAPECWTELCYMKGHLEHLRMHCKEAITWLESTIERLVNLPEVREAFELDDPDEDCDGDTSDDPEPR